MRGRRVGVGPEPLGVHRAADHTVRPPSEVAGEPEGSRGGRLAHEDGQPHAPVREAGERIAGGPGPAQVVAIHDGDGVEQRCQAREPEIAGPIDQHGVGPDPPKCPGQGSGFAQAGVTGGHSTGGQAQGREGIHHLGVTGQHVRRMAVLTQPLRHAGEAHAGAAPGAGRCEKGDPERPGHGSARLPRSSAQRWAYFRKAV